MKNFSAFLDMRSYKNWNHKIFSWKYLTIWRPILPVFPRAQNVSFLICILKSFQGVLRVSNCSSLWFNPRGGRMQMATFSWNYLRKCSWCIFFKKYKPGFKPCNSLEDRECSIWRVYQVESSDAMNTVFCVRRWCSNWSFLKCWMTPYPKALCEMALLLLLPTKCFKV